MIYGITYIDHRSKTVFNGSDIGVSFSAKAILEKCGHLAALKPTLPKDNLVKEMPMLPTNGNSKISEKQPTQFELKLPEVNLSATPAGESIPYQLKKRRRRKKKRISICPSALLKSMPNSAESLQTQCSHAFSILSNHQNLQAISNFKRVLR